MAVMSLGDLLLPSLFRTRLPRLRLGNPERLAFEAVPAPGSRLLRVEATLHVSPPRRGDTIAAGEVLGHLEGLPVRAPAPSRVVDVRPINRLHGGRPGYAVVLEANPDGEKAAPLEALDADAEPSAILERLDALGVVAYGTEPAPLAQLLGGGEGAPPTAVVLRAIDEEPLLASERRLLEEHLSDIAGLVELLARASAGAEVFVAVPESHAAAAHEAAPEAKVVAVPDRYPEGLAELVARRAVPGGKGPIAVVSLESALAARLAVAKGSPPTERFITVVGADESCRNVKVAVGTPVRDLLEHLSMTVVGLDLIAAGGPMRGKCEPLSDASVDATTTALMVVADATAPSVENDPCVTCGSCVEVCPVQLQPQLLGRNAEFGFFGRNSALRVDCCVRCGLCAYVCPSGRPLLQWIELTLAELRAVDEAEEGA